MRNKRDQFEARKQMLQMKARIERLELAGHVQVIRQDFGWLAQVRRLIGWVGGRGLDKMGSAGLIGQQALNQLAIQNPYLGLAASFLLLRFNGRHSSRLFRGAAAAVMVAGAVYWFKFKMPRSG